MNTAILSKIENKHLRTDLPDFNVGDTIEVNTIIREGDKQRIQAFKGLVIAIKGSGTNKMFTVRKISYGIGVEKTFPLLSKNIDSITIEKTGKVRRAKLYYLRDRVGRLALKVKPGGPVPVVEYQEQAQEVLESNGQVELAKMDQTAPEATADAAVE
jgi:large subunit ribosomal protein L19